MSTNTAGNNQQDEIVDVAEESADTNQQTDEVIRPDDYDTDPMIVAMREAEKEIEESSKKAESAGDGEGDKAQTAAAADAKTEETKTSGAGESPTIPKARFDEVLREREDYRAALQYTQGILDAQAQMLKGGQPRTEGAASDGGQKAEDKADPIVGIDEQISAKEAEILALAQKYEDGDMSLVDMEKARIEIERGIRSLADQRVAALIQKGKDEAAQIATGHIAQTKIENEALSIQQNHPYVAEIDQLPPAIRDGVWAEITNEAMVKLAQQGINPNDGTVESRMALIREKAALTNVYGPRFTGKQLQPGQQNNANTAAPAMTEAAQNRLNKANVAAQQPPSIGGVGSPGTSGELTPEMIESMTEDQIADLLSANAGIVYKAAGFGTNA